MHRCVPERQFHCQTVYPHYSWPKWQVRLGRAPWRVKEVESGGQVKAQRGKEPSVSCSPKTVVQTSLEQGCQIVLHQNFLIRLVGNFTSDADDQARSCWFFFSRVRKSLEELFTELHARKCQVLSFQCKKEREWQCQQQDQGTVCYFFLQGFIHPFWCALSTAQMDDPSLSEDIGTPVQSDSWDRIHHPDKRK